LSICDLSVSLYGYPAHLQLHSFPTRRSSDLTADPGISPSSIRNWITRAPKIWVDITDWVSDSARVNAIRKASMQIRRRCGSEKRSEEHTSELQSRENLVCRLLLEKKKNK